MSRLIIYRNFQRNAHLMTVLIFSVSIGRRLMDPLAEFVKYDPKHLGVGQYQVPRALSKLTNKNVHKTML